MSMPKLNAPVEIHWRRSNMNTRDPILMKSVEVLKDCRSLNAAAEMNCPMPRSVEKVPIRNEKRCIRYHSHVTVFRLQRTCERRKQQAFYKCRQTSVISIASRDTQPEFKGHKKVSFHIALEFSDSDKPFVWKSSGSG